MGELQLKSDLLTTLKEYDLPTFEHSLRVADLLKEFGIYLDFKQEDINELYVLGLYHDIGKLYVDEHILQKKGKLSNPERNIIFNHTIYGHLLMRDAGHSQHILEGVLYHHENYNGTGYPYRYEKDNIPLFAHMLRIVDSYDAMTSQRTYQNTFTKQHALHEIEQLKGTIYHPVLAAEFLKMNLS